MELNIKLALDLGLNVFNNCVDLSSSSVVVVDHKTSMLIGNTGTRQSDSP